MDTAKKNDVYLGLDIGSNSVGWAVCTTDYRLSRYKGKDMWGVRLFDEAKTAEERRTFRIMRRRIERRNQRLGLLQTLFEEAIKQKDPSFFQRLQAARLWPEDKGFKYTIFHDDNYTDREYHRQYPTIYHLRQAFLRGDKIDDVRLLYLAIHHILKYRGHFLLGDIGDNHLPSLEDALKEFSAIAEDELGFSLKCNDPDVLEDILKNRQLRLTDKQKAIQSVLRAEDKQQLEWVKALAGSKVSLSILFDDDTLAEAQIAKVQFSDPSFEDDLPELEAILGERLLCLEKMRAVYNWAVMQNLLSGYKYLSDAKVAVYQQHKEDLRDLKQVIRKHGTKQQYHACFFSVSEEANYAHYIGTTRINGHKQSVKHCSQDELCKYIITILKNYPQEDTDVGSLLKKAQERTLLPKIVAKDNSVIPYQIHRIELRTILSNAADNFPFVSDKDENGLSVSEKIIQILEFRIPYYVGPLNRASENSWFVRAEQGKIYPWNFDQKVDIMASARSFIDRMTARCTYLHGKYVLPRCSPLYERFTVLNEINPMTIKGVPISVHLKQEIYNDLIAKHKKVTMAMLVRFLNSHGFDVTRDDIGGIDSELNASLKTTISLKTILAEKYSDEIAEEIVSAATYFGDDRKMLRKCLNADLSLPDDTINRAVNLRCTGWGRLSRELLCDIVSHDSSADPMNIITALWETNENLMGLLSERYSFMDSIVMTNKQSGIEDSVENYIDELYVSPSVKRQIEQTLTIVRELRKVIGHDPKKVFVEMARGGEKLKERKLSRKAQLAGLYKGIKDTERDWFAELQAQDDDAFRRDKLYLYYTQMGRCMYTGEAIDLKSLYDENLYDIDHIYPRSKVKDDSLNNRVLVRKQSNQNKTDIYPISQEIRSARRDFWKMLLDRQLIQQEKYKRLTRTTPFSESELTEFIARQLVETRQGSKAVAELLKRLLPQSEIVYVKAGNVSDFRRDRDMLKVREVNDLHHAKDAYLNIVVGNVYNTKFTHSPANFIQNKSEPYNLHRMFDFDVVRGGVVAWETGKHNTMDTVRRMMDKNSALVTVMPVKCNGALFDVQPMQKGQGQHRIKKDLPIDKYGGYNKVRGAYFMLVEHKKRGNPTRTIVEVPIHLVQAQRHNSDALLMYCRNEKGFVEPKILIPLIRTKTLICINGFRMYLSGRTGDKLDMNNANQLFLGYEWEKYIKRLIKYCTNASEYEKGNKGKKYAIIPQDGLTTEKNNELYHLLIDKLNTKPYCLWNSLKKQADMLKSKAEQFTSMNAETQCRVLREVIKLFTRADKSADMSLLLGGGGGQTGTIRPSSDITNYTSVQLIHQSPTGLFEHVVDMKI